MATGIARNAGYRTATDGQEVSSFAVNKRQELIVVDFWTQLVLEGRMFHIQLGTENAPVNTTAVPDDILVWCLVDGQAGTTIIPSFVDITLTTFANTAVTGDAMLEIDRAKNRYTSGGTAYVPENLRTDRPRASNAAAYVWSTDIVASAKTAVPGSIEIARKKLFDAAPTTTNEPSDFLANLRPLYTVATQPAVAIVGVGSMIIHAGCATADTYLYGMAQWAELPTSAVI